MKIKITVRSSQSKIAIPKQDIVRLARRVLKLKGVHRAEMGILFVGQRRIRSLNKIFRNCDRPTDVLAFGMRQTKIAQLYPALLGDVVICPQVARSFARIYNTTPNEEISLDVIHGILHLLGHDDSSPRARKMMEKEQTALLRKTLHSR